MVKRVTAYVWKTLTYSQQWYCTTNKKLLAVVTAVELFKYYLMGRYFTVVTDHEVKTLWSQYSNLEIRDGFLL